MRRSLNTPSSVLRLLCGLVCCEALLFGQVTAPPSLSSTPNPANYGQAVTLQATLPAGASGKVTFYDGATVLGVSTVSGTQATLTITLLASGTRSLRAYYPGNAVTTASSSAPISQTVVAGASLGFRPAVQYPTTATSEFTAVGDFNGDGKQDLAIATQSGVNILLGNGDGTFQAAVNYSAGTFFGCVVAGDFNGDGKTDLALSSDQYSSNISVLLGNGDGTFQTAVSYAAGYYPESVVAADFNGDGIIDLATANYGYGVNVLLGNGDGTFRAAVNYATGVFGASVAVADLNGDGKADLVIATDNGVSVLLGKGDGTFLAATTSNAGTSFSSIAVADFNGDGKADLALTGYYSSSLSIMLGNGDGTFQPAVTYGVSYGSGAVIAGDFNGDGRVDLAAASSYCCASIPLNVLFGNGDGTFQAAVSYSFAQYPVAVAAGDFNGDGKTDLVASGQTFSSTTTNQGVNVLPGGAIPDLSIVLQRTGGLTQGQIGAAYDIAVTNVGAIVTSGPVGVVATLPTGIAATAIAGNGWTCGVGTLVCVRNDSLAAGASYPVIKITVSVASNLTGNVTSSATVSGGGDQNFANNTATDTAFVRFSSSTSLTASPGAAVLGHAVTLTATVTSDATGKVTFYDGVTVLGVASLAGAQATLVTYLLPSGTRSLHAEYEGDSTYGPSVSAVWIETIAPVAANGVLPPTSYKVGTGPSGIGVGDFNRDGKLDLATAIQGGISVQLGNGDGTFRPAVTTAVAGTYGSNGLVIGDFNGDGNPDIAFSTGGSGIYVLLGNGDGTFQTAVEFGPVSTSYSSLAGADFNRDGKLDLVTMSNGSPVVFLGNGDGTFQSPVTIATGGTSYGSLTVADLNGDGKPDLVCLNTAYSGGVGVLLGNGDGTFQLPVNYTDSSVVYADSFVVGDFNGDGKLDVAVIYWVGVTVFLGNGDGTLGTLPLKTQLNSTPGYFAIAGDFNGDGKLDIAYTGYYSDYIAIAFGNGDGTFQHAAGTTLTTDGYNGDIAVGDFNGDGKLDFAVSNNSSNTVDVFLSGQFSGLALSLSHTGSFTIGQTGTYQAIVSNPAFAATSGTVTFTDTLPAGMTAASIAGSGWTCTLSSLTCTQSNVLNDSTSYPAISIVVNVAANLTPSTLTNRASVSNGGIVNSASDPTHIVLATTTALAVSPNPSTLGQPVTLTATVTAGATGAVEFFDGGAMLGAASLTNGQASMTTRLLGSGTHSLLATYSGDTTHAASSSGLKPLTVNALQASGLAAPVSYTTGTGPTAIATGDFNGDGKTDVVTANSGANTVSVLLGNGDGTYRAKVDYVVGTLPASVVVADFNNDGKADLAVVNTTSNNLSILLGNGDGTFQTAVNYATGNGPVTLAAADFNGDGEADLVVGNASDGSLSLFFGNGDGTFHVAASTIYADGVTAVSIGDFNKDGKTDIVYGWYGGIDVLLGNGDGTFQQSYSYYSGYGIAGLAAADLNSDGKSDLVAVSSSYGVYVFLGNGDGTFQSSVNYPAGSSPLGVVIADVNGDGKLDVVAANSGGSSVSLLLGNGDGTLQTAESYTVGSQPRAVAAGDFNGDGRTDLAIANYGSNSISVMLGIFTPVLSAASTHTGAFAPGQTGAVYTIAVTNNGPGPTSGTVTLTDTLPSSLTATALAGTGWSCVLATVTCTRSDSLAASAGYPAVTLTVSVSQNAPFSVTNLVGVTGVNAIGTSSSDVTAIVGVTAASVAPASGSGVSQTFTLVYSDTKGAADLASAQMILNASNSVASACYVWVTPSTGAVWLANDNGTSWPAAMTLGTGGTEQNSQCTLNVAASSGTLSGNTYTLTLTIGFHPGFSGAKSVYGYATTQGGFNSGWQSLGSWTVPVVALPQAVSVTPSSGSGTSQAFTLVYNDGNGIADLASAQVIVGTSNSSASACYVWVTPASGAVWLANDNGTWAAAMTLGTAGTLQNSQCAVNVGSSSGTLSGNTYTLNLALSFQSGFSGVKNIYSYASGLTGLNSGWQTVGTWTAGTVSAIHAVSVNPASGSGGSQVFSLQFSDSAGASDLATVSALINTSTAVSTACSVTYNRANNTLALLTDAGAQPSGTITPGSSSQQNSQCTLTGSASSVTVSGNVLTLNLAIGFRSGFAGAKNVYGSAQSAIGISTGLQLLGTWTVAAISQAPQAASVTPASGTGASQAFTFVYTDVNGAPDLASAQAMINASNNSASSCYVWVTPGTGTIWLAGDAGNWPASLTLGTAGTLQNSQCAVNAGSSSGTLSGNTYTLNLAITFESGFSGVKNIYSLATSLAGLSSGWQTVGAWTAGTGSSAPAIHAVSVSPPSGSGASQTFTFVYTDSNSASDLASAQAMIDTSITSVSSCYVWVTPGTGTIWLAGDAGNWPASMTLGTAGTLQNSQCAVNVGSSSGALAGNTYTLNLAISFQSGFSGVKNIYSMATSMSEQSSGWQMVGTWTAASAAPAIHAVSVNPSSGSGVSQTFTFVYTDSNGASDFASAQALINSSITSVSSCYVWVTPGTGTIWLAANAGNWPASMTLGTAGTLQNSQCAVNVGSSSGTLSGNTYTLNLAISFESGVTGAKNIYSDATSLGGLSPGWQTVGTWTP